MAEKVVVLVIVLGATFLLWTQLAYGKGWTWVPVVLAAVALVVAALMNRSGREGLGLRRHRHHRGRGRRGPLREPVPRT